MAGDTQGRDVLLKQLQREVAIDFRGFMYFGAIPIDEGFPKYNDHAGYTIAMSKAMKQGKLSMSATQRRQISISITDVLISSDDTGETSPGKYTKPEVYEKYPIKLVCSMTHIDDHPNHMLAIVVDDDGQELCKVFHAPSADLVQQLVETFDALVDHLYTQAVLFAVDDSITAALEGRPTSEQLSLLPRRVIEPEDEEAARRELEAIQEESSQLERRRSVLSMFRSDLHSPPIGPAPRRASRRSNMSSPPGVAEEQGMVVGDLASASEAEFMDMLAKALSKDEMIQFTSLVKDYRDPTDGDFVKFVRSMERLLGPGRRRLLHGMAHLVMVKDRPKLEAFLAVRGME